MFKLEYSTSFSAKIASEVLVKLKKYKTFLSKVAKSGFYIILFLCISAIGISAYVMFLARDVRDTTADVINTKSSLELPFPIEDEAINSFGEKVIVPIEDKKAQEEIKKKEEPEKEVKKATEKATPTIAERKEPARAQYTMAVSGIVSEPFSGGELVKSETLGDWRIHSGVDIDSEVGTPVKAIADGTVSQVATDTMMGNVIKLEHQDGLVSVYANLADGITLKVGDKIKGGQEIGKIGTSALAECLEPPHLHLEVLKNGENIDPLSLYPAGEE